MVFWNNLKNAKFIFKAAFGPRGVATLRVVTRRVKP